MHAQIDTQFSHAPRRRRNLAGTGRGSPQGGVRANRMHAHTIEAKLRWAFLPRPRQLGPVCSAANLLGSGCFMFGGFQNLTVTCIICISANEVRSSNPLLSAYGLRAHLTNPEHAVLGIRRVLEVSDFSAEFGNQQSHRLITGALQHDVLQQGRRLKNQFNTLAMADSGLIGDTHSRSFLPFSSCALHAIDRNFEDP